MRLSYHDYAEEQDEAIPEPLLLFGKASIAVTNTGDPIVHLVELKEVDYDVELGVVIGRTAKNVSATDARDYVAGYTAINDVSGCDVQTSDVERCGMAGSFRYKLDYHELSIAIGDILIR